MLTARETQLVQETWEMVVPIAEHAALLFYGRLFELDPSLKPMFAHVTVEEQGRKLMQTLTVAVRGLKRLDALVPAIEELGKRHAAYGVKPQHYETVASALLWTLEMGLGPAFTDEVREAWAKTYWALANVMLRAKPMAA